MCTANLLRGLLSPREGREGAQSRRGSKHLGGGGVRVERGNSKSKWSRRMDGATDGSLNYVAGEVSCRESERVTGS